MAGTAVHSLAVPRLRLTRHSPIPYDDALSHFPQAGPSRLQSGPVDLPTDYQNIEEEEDTQVTPRIPTSTSLAPNEPADNPAARLRALLARVPNHSASNNIPAPHPSSSEPESDFDPPDPSPATPSFARESLKELFSRVLRDPADTPPKHRRRNSIDSSVDGTSPRLRSVELEKTKSKNKRGSLSDEEVDKLSKYQKSETSVRSAQAATYDSLRAKLTKTHADATPPPHEYEDPLSDASDVPADRSEDTATLQRQLDASSTSPPEATSTPLRSMQMPSQMQMHSNLLEQDSEMQKAMNGLDSYEADERPPFPPPRSFPKVQSRPPSRLPHLKSPPSHDRIGKNGNAGESSRAPSRTSAVQPHPDPHERERERNRSDAKTPLQAVSQTNHQHSSSSSNHALTRKESGNLLQRGGVVPKKLPRRDSSASVLSSDGSAHAGLAKRGSVSSLRSSDGFPSRAPSAMGSRADHREGTVDLEKEKGWNKPHPKLSSANLTLHSSQRMRTYSHPARPDSAQSMQSARSSHSSHSHLTPVRPRLRSRTSSITSSGRGSSIGSRDIEDEHELEEEEEEEEVQYVRERNWNSPLPKWERPSRASSPLPPSRASSPLPSHSRSRIPSFSRRRTESFGVTRRTSIEEEGEHSPGAKEHPPGTPASHSSQAMKGRVPGSPASPLLHPKSATQSPSYLGLDSRPANYPRRPNSPIPPVTRADSNPEMSRASERPSKRPAYKAQTTFQFPARNRSPLPPLELDQDSPQEFHAFPREGLSHARTMSSPAPGMTTGDGATTSIRGSRVPVRPQNKSGDDESLDTGPHDGERKKGHRRSLTEFGEAVGSAPLMIKLEGTSLPNGPNDLSPDTVFTSDEESLPATSTPTVRTAVLHAEEAHTLPNQAHSEGSVYTDEQRLQKALTTPSSPRRTPPSSPPPPETEPLLSLATPPRRQSNASKLDFRTPSPPKGMPELPGPPSSGDETEEIKDFTPDRHVNGSANLDFSTMKTPKPPGAWAATPVPPARTLSLPDIGEATDNSDPDDDLAATPVSRAASLPPQTPAPPGAWLNTPASRRKSILKVRFEVETSESEVSRTDIAVDGAEKARPQINGPKLDIPSHPIQSWDSGANGDPRSSTPSFMDEELNQGRQTPETPVTPASPSVRTPRRSPRSPRSPSVRVVDAFGRETYFDEPVTVKEEDVEPIRVKTESPPNTPRSKSTVRIVDAMGREVQDSGNSTEEHADSRSAEESSFLTHNEALARVRETIAELREGLSDVERSSDELALDPTRRSELDRVSNTARGMRSKLYRSLQLVKTTEHDFRSKYGPLRESMRRSRFLPVIVSERRWGSINVWTVGGFVLLQLMIILFMYRMSVARARRIFLTTYYDPYYPDVHSLFIKPDTFRYSSASPPWSIFSVPDSFQRVGWQGALMEVWGNVTIVMSDWQRQAWEAWGTHNSPSVWPPT